MNRNFPPETIEPCDHCGHDLTLVITEDGTLEANDQRDYVDDQSGDPRDRVIVCAGCRVAMGIGDDSE
jgi:hypothetical protein